mmetsp:Transcript_10629/g.11946  ORF Transcript_10629/g.11946 Transcript_10629/m.11946 type:complete len:150 (+) Transcript_10629:23-472(+)
MNKEKIMEIYLMRHGESHINKEKYSVVTEVSSEEIGFEPDLSERGKAESLLTGQEFKRLGIKFNKIICSPMLRALRSAEFILKGMEEPEMHVDVDPKTFEQGGSSSKKTVKVGDKITYKGLSKAKIEKMFPFARVPADQISDEGWYTKD